MGPELVEFSAEAFFDDVCGPALALRADAARALGGTVAFRVFGDGGGAWLVDLSNASVERRLGLDADVLLEIEAADLDSLLRGQLDVAAATGAGRLRCRGDLAALAKLGALLDLGAA